MSHDVTPLGYETRLGNPTAKSVLALLADVANDEGYGWPSVQRIARKTEIKERTVRRIIQVFVEIGLIAKVDRGRDKSPGLQLAMDKIGADLRKEFAAAYAKAQRKKDAPGGGRRDTVAETAEDVAETAESVAETAPPHPLNGGTVMEPPVNRQCDDAPEQPDPTGLDAEQSKHLEELRAKGREADVAMWESFYHAQNVQVAQADAAARADRKLAERLRAAMPTPAAARVWVMRECGFVSSRRDRELEEAIEAVLVQDTEAGEELWATAHAMAAAWKRYQAEGPRLRVIYGPVKFYLRSIWRDSRGWAYDQDKLREERRQAEARVGS